MHPYQYVSFNLLAGDHATIPNRYESEYWFTSSKHLLEAMPALTRQEGLGINTKAPTIRISGPLSAAIPFVPNGFTLVNSIEQADYYISNTTFRTDLLAEGEVVYEIKRAGIPIGVIKKLSSARK